MAAEAPVPEVLAWARQQRERMRQQRQLDSAAAAAESGVAEEDADAEYDPPGVCWFERDSPTEWARLEAEGRVRFGSRVLHLSLASHRKFFAARLWPAARLMARHLERQGDALRGLYVLEVGAGAGLPSLVAALCGAGRVLITDVPNERMLSNTRLNLEANVPADLAPRVHVRAHDWAWPPHRLRRALAESLTGRGAASAPSAGVGAGGVGPWAGERALGAGGFDLILLSDVLYELDHEALLLLIDECLAGDGGADAIGTEAGAAGADAGWQARAREQDPMPWSGALPAEKRPEPAQKRPEPAERRPEWPAGAEYRPGRGVGGACVGGCGRLGCSCADGDGDVQGGGGSSPSRHPLRPPSGEARLPTPHVLLSFQPHDPVQLPKQLRFFQMARTHPFHLRVTPLAAARAPKMFPRPDGMSDAEDEQSRRVYLFGLSRVPAAQRGLQPVGPPFVLPEPEGWVEA